MRLTLTPYGRTPVTVTSLGGWRRLDTDIGVQVYAGDVAQFRCARGGWYALAITFANGRVWQGEGYLPPRAILTIRPDSPAPTHGLLRLVGDASDFSGGGGAGIDACGAPGTVHDHDAVMNRHAVGVFNMETGKLRDASTVPVDSYYALSRGWRKVGQLPDYCERFNPSDPYDDRRIPAIATAIPENGASLVSQIIKWHPFDGQHLIRAYRFALLLQHDAVVRDDMRAMLRDAELAWDEARVVKILQSPGGIGHAEDGRELAWVGYLAAIVESWDNRLLRTARSLFGIGFAARVRRIHRHVAHRVTGILQRFEEGMSGSPYPYGDKPNSGVTPGVGICLTQHLEACAAITSLDALGMKAEALKLARTILGRRQLKWINTDTGLPEGGGWHGPANDQAWPAIGVLLRLSRVEGIEAAMRHSIPTDQGGSVGPFSTVPEIQVALAQWTSGKGKTAWARRELAA